MNLHQGMAIAHKDPRLNPRLTIARPALALGQLSYPSIEGAGFEPAFPVLKTGDLSKLRRAFSRPLPSSPNRPPLGDTRLKDGRISQEPRSKPLDFAAIFTLGAHGATHPPLEEKQTKGKRTDIATPWTRTRTRTRPPCPLGGDGFLPHWLFPIELVPRELTPICHLIG